MAIVFLLLGHCLFILGQEKNIIPDSVKVRQDTTVKDTIIKSARIAPGAIDKTITYGAKGYRKSDLVNKKVYLVEEAVVNYGDITLKADSIILNMDTKVIYATGRRDSTGKVVGLPNFKQGNESFDAKELTYNFNTGKARVTNMVTKQDEGYLHSGITKKFKDGTFNIGKSTYSTCDANPPHFYVGFNKAKVIPGKKIITGPAYMVLEDVPLPLIIPFGFFPIQNKRAESGIIIPKPGQSFQLGYNLRSGGYYFAINDNFDLAITGDIYTNGTWLLNATSSYVVRYRYSGRLALSFANNITGHKGLSDYSKSSNYRIDWSYNQDAKAHPGSRFSASVSMSSSSFDRTNSYVPAEHVNTTRQSSVSYSKTWEGTPFNFSMSLNHSQNMSTKTVSVDLPKATFSMSRIYPLKPKNMTGQSKWWQELQLQYTANVDNQVKSMPDSLLFTRAVFKNMANGFKHDIPLSVQIRPFKSLKGFTISPQVAYSGVLYTQKFNKYWDPNHFDADLNKVVPSEVTDTLRGLFYGQAINVSMGTAVSPTIYGDYQFKSSKPRRLQGVRHTIKPTIGFSYTPAIKGLSTDMYRTVQTDTTGRTRQYSIFEGNIFGTPSLSSRSGGFSFGLINIVEAKIFQKNDTTGKAKKIKIIDNFTINTSYNIFADSLRWAPLTMSYRTVLFESFNIAANSNFSFYGLSSDGSKTINTFYLKQTGKPLRLTSFSTSLDFDLNKLIKKISGKKTTPVQGNQPSPSDNSYGSSQSKETTPESTQKTSALPLDKYGYVNFDMPWSLRFAYSLNYTKPTTKSVISQFLALSGDVSLTKKTKITYTTGYDIQRKEITMTSISIIRDLHCWEMAIEWIPVGYMKSWSFTIKVRASVLADLKYQRRKDFHDQY